MKVPMTDLNWPAELQCVFRSEYGLQDAPTFETSTLATGREFTRRLFSFVPTDIQVQFVLTDLEASVFAAFYRDMLNDGVKWFNMDLKTPRAKVDNLVVRFKSAPEGPRLHQNGDRWVYRATLQAFERPMWPPGWGQFPDWMMDASRFDVLMNWVWPKWESQLYPVSDQLIGISKGLPNGYHAIAPNGYSAISIQSISLLKLLGPLGESILREDGSQNLCTQSNPGSLWTIESRVNWQIEESEIGLGGFFATTDLQAVPAASNRISAANALFNSGKYTLSFFIEIDPSDVGQFLAFAPGAAFGGRITSFRVDTATKTTSLHVGGVVASSMTHVSGNTYRTVAFLDAVSTANDFSLRIRPNGSLVTGKIKIGGVQINRGHGADYPIETNGVSISLPSDYSHQDGIIDIKVPLLSSTKIFFSGTVEGYPQ